MVGVGRLHHRALIRGVGEQERHRLAVLHLGHRVAVGVHLVLQDRLAAGVELGFAVLHHRLLRDHVVDRRAVDQLQPARAFGVVHAVGDRDDREHQQRGDLHDVDDHVDRRRAGDTAKCNVGHAEREHDAEQDHEQRAVERAAERVGEELVEQVAADDRGHAHHAPGVDPVIEVTGPPGDELGDARKPERVGLVEERLLGEEIRRAGAGIELRQLGVAHRRRQAQQQGGDDPEPHRRSGHRRAVERLDLVGQPEEGAGRDQRHGVDREPGQAQGGATCALSGGGRCCASAIGLFSLKDRRKRSLMAAIYRACR